MALALYRKYRPATFAEVIGQDHVTEPLRTALAAGRINHAYLFSGPRGCGKTSSARILARSLNCEQGPTPDPCGVCDSCVALAPEGPGSLDVVELDAASHGGVDDTRDLRDRAFYMPAQSRYRVFIIDEAHMVSTQGFNALLKIVEEPPEHLVFVFATTEPEKVLTTIRSRTHHYPFRLIPPATMRELVERLCAEEGVTVDPAVFSLVIRAGGGSARDTLSVLDQLLAGAGPDGVRYADAVALLGVTDAALLDEMADALAAADAATVFGVVDKVVEAGHDPRRFAADLLQRLRDLILLRAVPDAGPRGLIGAPDDELAAMAAQADKIGPATLSRLADVVHTGLVDMRGTTAPRLVLELMCARMLLPHAQDDDAAFLHRLERVERRMQIAAERTAEPGPAAVAAADRPAPRPSQTPDAAPAVPTAPPTAAPPTAGPASAESAEPPAVEVAAPATRSTAPAADPPPAAPAAAPPRSALGIPQRPTLSSRAGSAPGGDRPAAGPRPPAEPDPAPAAAAPAASAPPAPAPAAAAQPAAPAASEPRRSEPRGSEARRSEAQRPEPGATRPSPAGDRAAAAAVSGDRSASGAGTPATPPVGEIGVVDVRRVWQDVLADVQRRRRATQILLESATVVEVSGRTLRLSMPTAGMAKRVTESGNAEPLRAALHAVLGVDWAIDCVTGDAASAGAGSSRSATGAAPSRGAQPARRPQGRSGGGDDWPVPEPPAEPDHPDPEDDVPDDYGDPDQQRAPVQDPEEAAMSLLASELGATRWEPGQR